jgi:hypothetical protein
VIDPNDAAQVDVHADSGATAPEPPELVATRRWLERAVIGLNLCPFVKAVYVKQQVRLVLSDAADVESLLQTLGEELRLLQASDPEHIDTTLIVHPQVLGDFYDYNDFLDLADALLAELDLEGELQIASFHPDYRFADTLEDDPGNATNRAPYPTLHLLRESSVERAVAAYPDPDAIVGRNLETMARLGLAGYRTLLEEP